MGSYRHPALCAACSQLHVAGYYELRTAICMVICVRSYFPGRHKIWYTHTHANECTVRDLHQQEELLMCGCYYSVATYFARSSK